MNHLEEVRRAAIRRLCGAEARGDLPPGMFEDRWALIKEASNAPSLEALVVDLPEETALVPLDDHEDYPAAFAPAESLRVSATLGSTKRAGAWTVPHHLDLQARAGEVVVDLRDAVLASDFLDIDVDCLLGSIRLIVPPGTQIENEVEELLGSTTHTRKGVTGTEASGLLVRIAGRVILGDLTIQERPSKYLPGREPARASWWRRLFGLFRN